MKHIKIFLVSLFMATAANAASTEFMAAAQLLAAAKSADIQQVQSLVNNGANINFVDSTGLSIVCTALMNNDIRAAQILQMYGADASRCDAQIKQYNKKNKPRGSGGLFSGLSSAQTLSLAAAGAAVVVGGLFLLTDVFDPGNDNDSGASGGNRPDNNNGGGTIGGNATEAFALAYGPAMPDAKSESENYVTNLNFYSPDDTSILAGNYALMTDIYGQNYLLMMHGYSPLARGYLGMQTLRSKSSNGPLDISGVNWLSTPVLGGRPVNVALVTANGIDSTGYAYDVDAKNSLTDNLLPWTTTNGSTVNNADNSMVSSKYYNNLVVLGTGDATRSGATTVEDTNLLANFDLADFGTVVNNVSATTDDNLLAKVIGGRTSGYANADFIGFMPNGQMTIYRTGGGQGFVAVTSEETGTYTETDSVLSEINLFGKNLTVTLGDGNSFVASYTENVTDDEGNETENTITYNGYIGTNGYLYIDSQADGNIDQAYSMNANELNLVQELQAVDYLNYKALRNAAVLWLAGDMTTGGRSRPEIFANASVIMPLRAGTVETIEDVLSLSTDADRKSGVSELVNKYYNQVDDNYMPGTDSSYLFTNLGSAFYPLVVFSTGAFETDSNWTGRTLGATFENAVPLVYENAEHLFMSVVAVGLTQSGTAGTETISGYSPSGKIALMQWSNSNGTTDTTDDDTYYKARACGIAGTGAGGIDPWCFAAAGKTDELAVSAAAGAAGAVRSAFPYLTNPQIFALLALTADGPLLGTTASGTAFTKDSLTSYLQSMYLLPNEYQYLVDNGADYLDTFAQVYGYGLINLERATMPGTKIFYYNGNDIVSADGNAYWRAASNTNFRSSAVFNPRGAAISAPFFDMLESVDGKMSLPRVWENSFALGGDSERALYMGDVLGELTTRRDNGQRVQIGNLGLSMAVSERAYVDNMSGLDNMALDYQSGHWNFGASYQHYFTDGESRFTGLSNPVLGLATNVVASDVKYKNGNWSFGARAFSGTITDEGLLENDPTISAQYMPAKLGLMQGAESSVGWENKKFAFTASVGSATETDTLLGAQSGGLLALGAGDTTYIDALAKYNVSSSIALTARATFAHTVSDASGEFILGLTDIESNAFAFGAQIGNFDFAVSQPLAIRSGALQYAAAEYKVADTLDGGYELQVLDTYVADLNLQPEKRETRFNITYRHNLGAFTDGAIGFIYRVNPNHTDDFGNESIFMLKMTHRLGI